MLVSKTHRFRYYSTTTSNFTLGDNHDMTMLRLSRGLAHHDGIHRVDTYRSAKHLKGVACERHSSIHASLQLEII